jgi:hypothetical protein
MKSDVPTTATDDGTPGRPGEPTQAVEDARRQLAQLVGRLLARHWLRTRSGPGDPARGPTAESGPPRSPREGGPIR